MPSSWNCQKDRETKQRKKHDSVTLTMFLTSLTPVALQYTTLALGNNLTTINFFVKSSLSAVKDVHETYFTSLYSVESWQNGISIELLNCNKI